MVTREQLHAGLETIKAVGDTVKELGRVPSGTVYAALSTRGVSLEGFKSIVRILVKAGVIREEGHTLVYAL